ncbi:histidine-containing phosphotransfer protein 4 [Abrus precatorius]|uniref:Histidine-containing phosphotransfer protein n=1 Tax=Abrus precatorius TaxID=3816 RepID=A0A8B8KFR5_ABRPR|nr:histidine-containing phosphotransfer protein 4 [Abrus precatorius]
MDTNQSRKVNAMKQSLFDKGFLNDQFSQLEQLQDDANPDFVEKIVTLYFRESLGNISNLEQILKENPLDFNKMERIMYGLNGSSSSIGAKKVTAEIVVFREYCRAGNAKGCKMSFQQLKKEHETLKKKLEAYFQLARRQAGPLETSSRPK